MLRALVLVFSCSVRAQAKHDILCVSAFSSKSSQPVCDVLSIELVPTGARVVVNTECYSYIPFQEEANSIYTSELFGFLPTGLGQTSVCILSASASAFPSNANFQRQMIMR